MIVLCYLCIMRLLLYIIALLVITGCSCSDATVSRRLDEADRLMLMDPSAAMERLNDFDVAEFNDSATLARWALLYSEAMAANSYHAPTDTIVNIAIEYYSGRNTKEELQHATRLKAILANAAPDALASAIYLQKEKEYRLYRERAKRERYMFIGIIVMLTAAAIIAWQSQRLRAKDRENEALIAEASGLRNDLSRSRSECSARAAKLSTLLDHRFSTIDDLCGTYYESQGTKTERKVIAEKVKSIIESVKDDAGLFAEMERSVNDCRDGVLVRIRTAFPAMKPEEYRLAVYLACGLSNRTIALLLGENIDVVYKRKSRLKARLATAATGADEGFTAVF